jgi:hypothetical protein
MGEVDPDPLLPLKIKFEAIALILHTILIEALLYLAGIILHPFDGRFHPLNNGGDAIFL